MSSFDEFGDECPTNAAKNENLLPAKSRERYIVTYENFITWKNEKNTSSFSEDVLMAYFEEIATKYKPSSLWAFYSMLKLGLKTNHGVNIEEYVKLYAFLKKLSKGYVCKKAKTLTMENVEKFIDEAPDDKYLVTKVALILAVTGGLRQQDLSEITTNDFENHGEVLLIKVPRTKNRLQGSFVIRGKYYNIVKKYQSLRTAKKGVSTRFFQQFRNGKCNAQVIGKNKFGTMPREIAEFLNLPDAKDYTGHSFRKASTITPDVGELNSESHETAKSNSERLEISKSNTERLETSKLNTERLKTSKSNTERLETSKLNTERLDTSKLNVTEEYVDECVNDAKSNTGAQDPLEFEPDEGVQCRFCGRFSNDCVAVSGHMPYLAGHTTTLAINHIRIELDFSNDSLPKTVCRHCDTKLSEICEFVEQVNTAQFSLVTVSQNVNNEIIKDDFHDIDAFTVTEEEYAKKTTIKRRSDDNGKNTCKKKAMFELETEFIMDIDIKEEFIDDLKDNGLPEYSDADTDVKPSEAELANSALVYRMYETSDSDLCNLTKNSENSEIGNSVIDRGLSENT